MFGYFPGGEAGGYWRRRFTVLIVGLAILGLAAWGLSSAIGVRQGSGRPAGPEHGRTGLGVTGHRATGLGTSGHDGAVPGVASGVPRLVSGSPAGPGTAQNVAQARRTSAGHGRSQSRSATIEPAFCGRRDIVLSLFTSQPQSGRGVSPSFSVNVVSTQRAQCSFNVGSSHLALVIKEGPVRIWSSADCAQGAGQLVTALRRGIPTVLAITWNRQTSAPGCGARAQRVPAGSYTAYAVDGELVSAPVTLRLN